MKAWSLHLTPSAQVNFTLKWANEAIETQRNGENMKPRCRSVQHHLSDYIDCTLSGRQTVIVAHHLRSCRFCQREIESLKRTKTLLNLYVQPHPPGSYDDLFWHQLERFIEKSPRPVWRGAMALWQSFVWRCQEALEPPAYFLSQQIFQPIQWIFDWVKRSPVYAWMLFATFAILLAYQFLLPQEEQPLDSTGLRHVLRASPFHDTPVPENRELIRNRERTVRVSLFSPEGWEREVPADAARSTSMGREDEAVELASNLKWEGYISSSVGDSDAFKAVASGDIPSDFPIVAQLSNPEWIGAREDLSRPLRGVMISSPIQVKRANHRSNSLVELLTNVPLRSLSIPEVYDSVKL
jgi:hypothetical protein